LYVFHRLLLNDVKPLINGIGTSEVEEVTFVRGSNTVHLIDTPGFNDSTRSDVDVLDDITEWLADSYKEKILLSGIVYLHRITEPRMSGTANRDLTMFKNLCGSHASECIVLATTGWPRGGDDDCEYREGQLKTKKEYWGDLCRDKSQVMRLMNTQQSALDIVDYLCQLKKTVKLTIQTEIVDKHLALTETSAANALSRELTKQIKDFEQAMEGIQGRLEKALERNDEKLQLRHEMRMAEMQEKLNSALADQKKLADENRRPGFMERVGQKIDNFLDNAWSIWGSRPGFANWR